MDKPQTSKKAHKICQRIFDVIMMLGILIVFGGSIMTLWYGDMTGVKIAFSGFFVMIATYFICHHISERF